MALLSLMATKATGVANLEKDPRNRLYVVPGATSPPSLRPVAESIFVMLVATFPEATDSVKLRLQFGFYKFPVNLPDEFVLIVFPRVTLAG